MAQGLAPGPWNQEEDQYVVDDGTMCRQPTPTPGHVTAGPQCSEAQAYVAGYQACQKILDAVDAMPELKGAGVVLQVPGGDAIELRSPDHQSGFATYVHAQITFAQPGDERTWWQRWNGVVLNCGGAAISWFGVGASGLAEIPSVGTSTPLLVVSITAATATSAQCGLAIAKETSPEFQEYVQSADGQWINILDITLDVISLAGGVAGAVAAVRSGGALLKTSKYASQLEKLPKGQLLKYLEKVEKVEKDLGYFRSALDKAIKAGKVADPVSRKISNNLLKRALPIMTKSLKREVYASLANVVGQALSTFSSYYGGVGSKGWGLVRIVINIYQESILGEEPSKP
jgi:hypothetical protein